MKDGLKDSLKTGWCTFTYLTTLLILYKYERYITHPRFCLGDLIGIHYSLYNMNKNRWTIYFERVFTDYRNW